MSALKNAKDAIAAKQAAAKGTKASDGERQESKVWLNIGYYRPNGDFISLPYGLPLDTMPSATNRGNSERNRNKDKLLAELLRLAALQPKGENITSSDAFGGRKIKLEVELYIAHSDDDVISNSDDISNDWG